MSKLGLVIVAIIAAIIGYFVIKTTTAKSVPQAAQESPPADYTIQPITDRAPQAPVVTAPVYIGTVISPEVIGQMRAVVASASETTPLNITKSVLEAMAINPPPVAPRSDCNATDPSVCSEWSKYNDVWHVYQTGANMYHITVYGALVIPPGWTGTLNRDINGDTSTTPDGIRYQFGDFYRTNAAPSISPQSIVGSDEWYGAITGFSG